jgi:hypothetical protein
MNKAEIALEAVWHPIADLGPVCSWQFWMRRLYPADRYSWLSLRTLPLVEGYWRKSPKHLLLIDVGGFTHSCSGLIICRACLRLFPPS